MKANSPSVSAIVLNYNGKHLLEESLNSLHHQTYSNFKIYVLDASSSDGSSEYIRKNYPKVTIINAPSTLGIAGSSNTAAHTTTESYLVFLSNDMKFDKNCISQLVETITKDPRCGICSAVLLKHDKDPITGKYHIDNAGIDVDLFGFISPHANSKTLDDLPDQPFETFASCGGCFIIKRNIFEKIGGFDTAFWGLSEDVDLSWRTRLLGLKVTVNPKSYLYHHISPSLGKLTIKRTRFLSERNNLRMLLKNYSSPNLFLLLPLYAVLEIGEVSFYLLRRRPELSISIIKAVLWNMIHLPDTLKQRRKIQKIRKVTDQKIMQLLSHSSFKLKIFPQVLKTKAI